MQFESKTYDVEVMARIKFGFWGLFTLFLGGVALIGGGIALWWVYVPILFASVLWLRAALFKRPQIRLTPEGLYYRSFMQTRFVKWRDTGGFYARRQFLMSAYYYSQVTSGGARRGTAPYAEGKILVYAPGRRFSFNWFWYQLIGSFDFLFLWQYPGFENIQALVDELNVWQRHFGAQALEDSSLEVPAPQSEPEARL